VCVYVDAWSVCSMVLYFSVMTVSDQGDSDLLSFTEANAA